MNFDKSTYGLAIIGIAAFVTSLTVLLIARGLYRYRLNWYEKNLLETQYVEISGNDANVEATSGSGGFWAQGKLKLMKSLSKNSNSSVDLIESGSGTTSNVIPLTGNNDLIITTSNNSLGEVITTQSIQTITDNGQAEDVVISDQNESNITGTIHLTLSYDKQAEILTVRIVEAQDLMACDFSGTADPYVKIRLLPDEMNIWQTRIHKKTINPVFDEDFVFELPVPALGTNVLEVIIYDFDANKRHHSLGGVRLPLSKLENESKLDVWEKLCGIRDPEPTTNNGELLVSLSYLTATECLTVSILKARNLRPVDNTRATSDPYAKLTFSCRDRKLKKCKTRIRRNTLCPVFNESFMFNISKDKLKHSCIQFDVLHDNLIGVDQILGTCAIGRQKLDSGEKNGNVLTELVQNKNAAGQWLPLSVA